MVPEEWVKKYLHKSGDAEIKPSTYRHACDKGFATWDVSDDSLIVLQVYGDGLYWLDFFKKIGKDLGLKITFGTRRNPKAWQRKFNAKVIGYIMEIDHG
jgi:hypothetical protein